MEVVTSRVAAGKIWTPHRDVPRVNLKSNDTRAAIASAGVPSAFFVRRNRVRRDDAVVTSALSPGAADNIGPPSYSSRSDIDDLFNRWTQQDPTTSLTPPRSVVRDFDDTFSAFRELDTSIERLTRRMEEEAALGTRAGTAPQTYRREERSEKQLPGGGYSKYYYSESVTTFGGGPPVTTTTFIGAQPFAGGLLWASIAAGLVVGAYATVVKRFMEGFKRTSYKVSSRLHLALTWPVLLVFGGDKFRSEFRRAVFLPRTRTTGGSSLSGGGGGGVVSEPGGDADPVDKR